MKLRTDIVERIKGRKDIKVKLAEILRTSRSSINRWLRNNENDGPLTKATALQVISEYLNTGNGELLTGTNPLDE